MQILCLSSIFNGSGRLGASTDTKGYFGVFTQVSKRLAALLLIGLLAPCFSYCEIIPDSSAAAEHRASVSQTPNAPATQIDIASPNDKGISINEYSKLNTPKEGTVFNNSRAGAISKTAGYIPPNPRLNRGEAKLIINQVNSPLPSNLQGNIEIAGKKADLIIANPSGINVNGATIINSSSTTLSTATPTYENGHLKSLNISKEGSINIGANGLNDNGDYLNVISNSLKLEGKIYANEINVVATDGKVSLKNTNSGLRQDNLKIEQEGGSHPKGVSIASSALGGMYAGKINIISTKDGAGINNKGAILADSSLKINANGDLINEGKLGSNGQTQISSKTVSNQKGSKISASNLGIKASSVENRGNIQANTLKIKADRLDNIKGTISSSSALKIEAKSLSNKDIAVIGAAKSERLKELSLDESKDSFKTGVIPPSKNELSIISADHISNIGGAILSNESYLDIKESLLNDNSLIVLRALDSEIPNFYNLSGSTFIVQEGLSLRGNNLRNESSKIISLGGALLGYDSIDNSKGSILSGGNLIINKGALNNEEGLISSKGDLALNLDSLSALGKLNSDGSLYLGLKDDLSYNGGIYAGGDIYLNLQGSFIALQRLISNKDLIINAKGIKNESIIAALGNLALKAKEQILNLGSLIARGELITNSESLINKKALVYAQDGINLNAKNILNQDVSNILSGGDIVINTSFLSNEALSNIISQRNLNIFNERGGEGKADEIINASSLIYAKNTLNIGAKKLNNRSSSELNIEHQRISGAIDLYCAHYGGWGCDATKIKLNVGEIKEQIIKKNPNLSPSELNDKLIEELSLRDINLYVLSLYKNTRLPGEDDVKLYDNLTIQNDIVSVNKSKPHKKEQLRLIRYNVDKEYISEDSLSKFMGSNIISAGDSNLNIDELNNDKSVIYAYSDLSLNVKSLNNRSLSLNHSITSQAEYRWKGKRSKIHGGYSDQKNIYYSQPAIVSIIGAKKDIKGYAGDISNLNSHGQINSSNAPTLIKEAFSKIDYSLIGKGLLNPNALNLNKNDLAPSLNNEADMQDIIKPSYINNLFLPTKAKFYNIFYVYSELTPDFSYMHNKLSLLYDKKRTSLNSSEEEDDGTLLSSAPSLIYAGGNINLSVNGDLRNEGIIYAGSNMNLKAGSVSNLNSASIIAGNALSISANKDIINASSLIQGRSVSLNAGRDIVHKTLSKKISLNRAYGDQSSTYIGTISNIKSTEGGVALNAARDITVTGASIDSAANLILNAANDVNINSAKEKLSYNFKSKGGYYKEDIVKNTSSKLNAKDNILIKADGIAISGADINARSGDALLQAKNSINLSGDIDSNYYESEFKEKGFASKKSTTTKALNQSVVPTSISAKNIMLSSQEADINIAGSALKAKEAIDMQAGDNINIVSVPYSSYYEKESHKNSFGALASLKKNHIETSNNEASSTLFSKHINLTAGSINLLASNITADRVNLNTSELNLISSKRSDTKISTSNRKGVLTATMKDKGAIKETEIPSFIAVKESLKLNDKDITDKLTPHKQESASTLNQDIAMSSSDLLQTDTKEHRDNQISPSAKDPAQTTKELSSNSPTPIDEKNINQTKAILNSKEWSDKTRSLSGVGSLIVTAVVTYLTAGAGSGIAGALTTTAATSAAVDATVCASIANLTVQTANMAISDGKVKFSPSSLAKSAITSAAGAYVGKYISGSSALKQNLIKTDYFNVSYADIARSASNAAITSGVYGTNFKDAFISALAYKASDGLFKQVGDAAQSFNMSDGSIAKIAMHSLAGGIVSSMGGGSFKDGAISAGFREMLSPLSKNFSEKDQILSSQLSGILAGGISGGDRGANAGYNIATSAEINNRQLHQKEVEWLNDKQKIAKFKDYIQKATSKRYTDDEAKKILAKGGISLSDESFNEAYKESLSVDELADIGLAKEYIKQSDFYNKDLDGTNAFNPTASQYAERYMYLDSFNRNKNFYSDNLKVDKPFLDDIAGFGKGFISGGWNFISNSVEGAYNLVTSPIETTKGIINTIPNIPSLAGTGLDKSEVDIMVGDYKTATERDTEGVTTVFTGGAGIVKGSAAIGKAALKQGLKEIPKKEIVKPALSKEQVNKAFVDSKSVNLSNGASPADSVIKNSNTSNLIKDNKANTKIITFEQTIDKIKYMLPGWIIKSSDKNGGIRIINPNNNQFEIRIMPGKIDTPNIAQQSAYIKIKTDKGYFDKYGNLIISNKPSKTIESHIGLENFDFSLIEKIYGEK